MLSRRNLCAGAIRTREYAISFNVNVHVVGWLASRVYLFQIIRIVDSSVGQPPRANQLQINWFMKSCASIERYSMEREPTR